MLVELQNACWTAHGRHKKSDGATATTAARFRGALDELTPATADCRFELVGSCVSTRLLMR